MRTGTIVRALLTGLLIMTLPILTEAGHGGSGGGSGMKGASPYGGKGQYPEPEKSGKGMMMQQQDQKRIHATDQQRDQVRACVHSADRLHLRTRDMIHATEGGAFNIDAARQDRERIRNEIRIMEEEQNRFMQGLNAEQREQMRERTRTMEEHRERLNSQFREMDQELSKSDPDRERISRQAREMERTMNEWQNEYRGTGSDMGMDLPEETK